MGKESMQNRISESRVTSEGHNVDRHKVIERYYKSLNNIKEFHKMLESTNR